MIEIGDEYWQHQDHHHPTNTQAHNQQVTWASQGTEPRNTKRITPKARSKKMEKEKEKECSPQPEKDH